MPEGILVVDVGSGTGTLALLLERRVPGATVVGLDPDPPALGRARKKAAAQGLEVGFVRGSATALPFGGGRPENRWSAAE